MNIVFFGTPYYVIPVLDAVHKLYKGKDGTSPIAAVVTQAPKPTGREKKIAYSAVDHWAHKKGIPIYFEPMDIINNGIEADIGILASYGEILSKRVIDHFRYGIINIHPSLLPKFRGSSPAQAAIICDGEKTGVSFTKMDEELDKGQLVSQFKEDIRSDDTADTLRDRLFVRSAEVIEDLLPAFIEGKIKLKKLNKDTENSFTIRIEKIHSHIPPKYLKRALIGETYEEDWKIGFIKGFIAKPTPEFIERFIRAMKSWPMAWSEIKIGNESKRIKILNSHIEDGKLVLDEVQLEAKNVVSFKQFSEGYKTAIFE